MNQFDTGHHLEEFAKDMGYGPVAGRSHIELARIGFGIGDEFRNRLGGDRWIDHDHIRTAANAGDRSEILDEIEVEFRVKRGVERGR